MPGIFISYRRSDTPGYAGRLFDHLSGYFGKDQVFRDIDRIKPGRDFVEALDSSIASCDALLVLIGGQWLTVADENGRRLHDPDDFVRLEISKALQRDVKVIPVLLPGAEKMPEAKDLPEDLAALPRRQAIKVSDETWDYDIDRLTKALEPTAIEPKPKLDKAEWAQDVRPSQPKSKALWLVGGLAAAVVAVVMFWVFALPGVTPPEQVTPSGAEIAEPRTDVSQEKQPTPPPAVSRDPEAIARKLAAPGRSERVRTAQSLLTSLGYDPGAVDGLLGAKTTAAVREFQADEGIVADGKITRKLINALKAAKQDEEDYALDQLATSPSAARPVTPPTQRPAVNLAGNWFDNNSIPYTFTQNGNQVAAEAYNPLTGDFLGRLEGSLNNGVLEYTYMTVMGTSGVGQATMEPDGRHMTLIVTDAVTGMTTGDRMHREHLPR